ncbi:MAG TPA: hypothetical protein VH085_08910 [Nocardioides sp.]|nr:hypothetical protein [Nocardioides sp.]
MDPGSEILGNERVRLPRRHEPHVDEPSADEPALDEHSARRRPGPGWWLLAIVLVAGLTVVFADDRVRSHESAAVQACELQLQRASDLADYTMGLTTSYLLSAASRDGSGSGDDPHVADLMAPKARRTLPAVQRADDACKAVRVRPWHFSLTSRQHAATAYAGALVTLLQIVAAQGRRPFRADPTLQRLRNAAGLNGG